MAAGLPTDRWKLRLDDYVASARRLHASILHDGVKCPVPVDPDYELLDGSHRVACALALGETTIPVIRESRFVWAPAWGREWFVENGMSSPDLARMMDDWETMRE